MSEAIGRLVVRLGDQIVQTVAVADQALTIGRNPDNGLPLTTSSQVSRYHADVRPDPQGLVLTDLASANGTFIGETRLLPHQPSLVAPGGTFRIGPFEITFEAALVAPPEQGDPEPEPVQPQPEQDLEPVVAATTSEPAEPSASAPGDLSRRERLAAGLLEAPPPLPSRDQASRYLNLLPMIFHENDFLRRYMLIFEALWEPLEYRQDHIQLYFDPQTCPVPFITWLAGWFDLSINQHWPEGRRRQVLAQIFDLYRWRGTRHGLSLMIELCTGLTPEIEDGTTPFVFSIRLQVPPGHALDPVFLQSLIESHKPAHAGYTLELTERAHTAA